MRKVYENEYVIVYTKDQRAADEKNPWGKYPWSKYGEWIKNESGIRVERNFLYLVSRAIWEVRDKGKSIGEAIEAVIEKSKLVPSDRFQLMMYVNQMVRMIPDGFGKRD